MPRRFAAKAVRAAVIALFSCMAACDSARKTASLAGVDVSKGAALFVEHTPLAVVGGAKDQLAGHALHRVKDGVLLNNGGILVATEGSQSILQYDSTGRFGREIGRSGGGPGEFLRIQSI